MSEHTPPNKHNTLLKENGVTIRSNEKEKKNTGQLPLDRGVQGVSDQPTHLQDVTREPSSSSLQAVPLSHKSHSPAQVSPYTEKQLWVERGVEDMRPFGPKTPL